MSEEQYDQDTPESQGKVKNSQRRNMLALILACLVFGGGTVIYLSTQSTNSPTSPINSTLDKRLQRASGQNNLTLTEARDYSKDYASAVDEKVERLAQENERIKEESQTKDQRLERLADNVTKLTEAVQQQQQQYLKDRADLKRRLDAEQIAREQEAQKNTGGFPTDVSQNAVNATRQAPNRGQGQQNNAAPPVPEAPSKRLSIRQFELKEKNFKKAKKILSTTNTLPAGSYAKGRIIVGAKTSAAVDAQGDPRPITIRLTGKAQGPFWRNKRIEAETEGCTITGSAYGDISSEQGHAKIHEMTCATGKDSFTTARVHGYLASSGMYGIHSDVVMREGDLISRAFWAGLLESSGSAVDTLIGTSSQSALGTVNTTGGADDALGMLAGEGLKKSGSTLSNYYIKRLEQIQPVIPIRAGTDVVVVFMKTVNLDGQESEDDEPQETARVPLGEEGSDIAPSRLNESVQRFIQQHQQKQQGKPSPAATNWNNEFY